MRVLGCSLGQPGLGPAGEMSSKHGLSTDESNFSVQ